MKPIKFNTQPKRGQWTVDVEGFGELAVVHSSDRSVNNETGYMWVASDYNMLNAYSPSGRKEQKRADRFVKAFNKMDFVMLQRDSPDGTTRDGYIAVYQVDSKVLNENGYSVRLINRMTK